MGIIKWTINARASEKIKAVYSKIRLAELSKTSDTHARMLFSMFRYVFASTNVYYDKFDNIFCERMNAFSMEIAFDDNLMGEKELSLLAK